MTVRSTSHRLVVPVLLAMLIGLVAGSASIVAADTSNSPIFRLGDSTDKTKIATVDSNGSLYVSQQGPISATLTNTDFPDAATHTKLDAANAQLGKLTFDGSGNLKTAAQGTTQVAGSVSVSNFPSDQQVHGTVTISNPGASGVTTIVLPTRTAVGSGSPAEWDGIDVSACRSFSVAVQVLGKGLSGHPTGLHIYAWTDAVIVADADVHERDGAQAASGGWGIWGYPSQPGTNEPFYSTGIGLYANNGDSATRDMTATLYCQH